MVKGMGRANLKIAVIGCEPKDCMKFGYGSARYDVRYMVGKKIEAFGEKYKTSIHWPVENIKDFPSTKNVDAVVIPGSPLNVDKKSLANMELFLFLRSSVSVRIFDKRLIDIFS